MMIPTYVLQGNNTHVDAGRCTYVIRVGSRFALLVYAHAQRMLVVHICAYLPLQRNSRCVEDANNPPAANIPWPFTLPCSRRGAECTPSYLVLVAPNCVTERNMCMRADAGCCGTSACAVRLPPFAHPPCTPPRRSASSSPSLHIAHCVWSTHEMQQETAPFLS